MNTTLAELPDSLIAHMVKYGCYSNGTSFSPEGPYPTKYLLVLAVPYGESDGVTDLPSALEAFRELMSDEDWRERNIKVLQVENGVARVNEVSYETVTYEPPIDNEPDILDLYKAATE